MEKPSDINSKKAHKLTRRRVIELAAASGFPATAALTMTPDDVAASDSDQVTIPFDVTGEYKTRVPADRYDHSIRTTQVTEQIKNRFMDREAVIEVSFSAQRRWPQVQVTLDSSNPAKEERRGEIPERQNEVTVNVIEKQPSWQLRHQEDGDGDCDPHNGTCNPQNGNISQLPGGVPISPASALGDLTNGPRMINGSCKDYLFGWSTAAHAIQCYNTSDDNSCRNANGCAPSMEEAITHNGVTIGRVVCVDYELDIAYIERNDTVGASPVSEIALPSNHSNKIHINGTVSESAMKNSVLNNGSQYPIDYRGITSCEITGGELTNVDMSTGYTLCDQTDDYQFVVHLDNTHGATGDSGSVPYVENNGNYFAIGSVAAESSCSPGSYYRGPQGYTIRDRHNIWWDDL